MITDGSDSEKNLMPISSESVDTNTYMGFRWVPNFEPICLKYIGCQLGIRRITWILILHEAEISTTY